MAGIEVIPVRSRAEMKAFIDLPWSIYQGDLNWIPPIRSSLARLLDPDRHPFWACARRELFLAVRGSGVVGRIAAIVDNNYNSYHRERMGGWGFFECTNNPEAAVALFSAAEVWVRNEGMEFLRGPLNPSTNYEVGMLMQGFESPPALGMAYNPPYYVELAHFSGFRKEKDLLSFLIPRSFRPPDWAVSLAKRFEKKGEIIIRKPVIRNLDAEVELLSRIYNECLARNWGFVPMTVEEARDSVKEMLPFVDMDLTFFIHYKDDAVGVCLILPDISPLLKRFNGRLGLGALIKKHRYGSEIKGLRGLIFGIKEEYRQMGVPYVAFNYLLEVLKKKENYQYLELGWNLEDNQAINRLYEEGGFKPHKRYRIYRKELSKNVP
jgi:GNAT superfamily N-acetyltransferase